MENLNIRYNNPNHNVVFNYSGEYYVIHLYTVYINEDSNGNRQYATLADIYRNGSSVILGIRCIQNQWLIPQSYQITTGNFRFECINNDYPVYNLFKRTQELVFYTTEEIESL